MRRGVRGRLGQRVAWGRGSDKGAFPAAKNMTLISCAGACARAGQEAGGPAFGAVPAVTPGGESTSPEPLLCFLWGVCLSLSYHSTASHPAPGRRGSHDQIAVFQGLTLDFKDFARAGTGEVPMTAELPGQLWEAQSQRMSLKMPLYLLPYGPLEVTPFSLSARAGERQAGGSTDW